MAKQYRVFISHADADHVYTKRIAQSLSSAGFEITASHPARPGASHSTFSRDAVAQCDAVLFLLSPTSLASSICEAECLTARLSGKPLYVAYIKTAFPGKTWLSTLTCDYADQRAHDLRAHFASRVMTLANAIRRRLDGEAPLTGDPSAIEHRLTGMENLQSQQPFLAVIPFLGRDDDLDYIRSLSDGLVGGQLIQIIAPEGMGKSRLAVEIALSRRTGAVWHRCTETSGAGDVLQLLRQHYQLDESAGMDAILECLSENTPLIVIDNAERIAPDDTRRRSAYHNLIRILTARGAIVLLTSRLAWSDTHAVAPHVLGPLQSEPAAHLVLEFAEQAGVRMYADEAALLARAARCHPRLIELAVPLLHHVSSAQIIERLHQMESHPFEAAMDAMIDQTLHLMRSKTYLGAEAEMMLGQLTVFQNDFDCDAALALRPEGIRLTEMETVLSTLVEWRLVGWNKSAARFHIDDAIISALPPHEMSAARHFFHYYRRFGDYDVNQNDDTHAQIGRDWLNIRQALVWGLSLEQPRAEILRTAIEFVIALDYAMNFVASYAEHREWLTQAHLVALRLDDAVLQAKLLLRLGQTACMQQDAVAARIFYSQARTTFETIGDVLGVANTLERLGELALHHGQYDDARAFYLQAKAYFGSVGSVLGQANVLYALGDAARQQKRFDDARHFYLDAKAAFEAIGSVLGQANTLHSLGSIARKQQAYQEARSYFDQALRLAASIGDLPAQLNALRNWGSMEQSLGNLALACDYLRRADALAQSHPFYAETLAAQHYRRMLSELEATLQPVSESPSNIIAFQPSVA